MNDKKSKVFKIAKRLAFGELFLVAININLVHMLLRVVANLADKPFTWDTWTVISGLVLVVILHICMKYIEVLFAYSDDDIDKMASALECDDDDDWDIDDGDDWDIDD